MPFFQKDNKNNLDKVTSPEKGSIPYKNWFAVSIPYMN